ncbi:unnamed protein product [Rotaria sp. Silwood1]|nr:unnamed protein product [Rotaria sp. Silwood1]
MQSISTSFYRNGLYNPDCIDRTDEAHNVEYWKNCFRDPAFRCEEHTCHPGQGEARLNCGDGQCVYDLSKCTNQRGMINTAEWILLDISESCWNGMVYTFLPVHRMAIEITISSYRPLRCSFACNYHGECVKYINHNDENSLYYCRCDPGWSGKDCTIKHDTCNLCARDSLCMYQNICICPLGKEGSRCYLKSTTCSSSLDRCQNGGLCIPSDMRRRKK